MYINHVANVHPESKAFEVEYRTQAIQIGPEEVYEEPLFKLTPKTCTAILEAIREIGPKNLDTRADIIAPPELIEAIRQYLSWSPSAWTVPQLFQGLGSIRSHPSG